MINARQPSQVQFYQLYVNRDRAVVKEILERVERGGMKALFITVDAPQLGRREKDMRHKFADIEPSMQRGEKLNRNQVSL
jgi:L-lactate dehydrogenase (cytochrome)